jgi:hypothetical protein
MIAGLLELDAGFNLNFSLVLRISFADPSLMGLCRSEIKAAAEMRRT